MLNLPATYQSTLDTRQRETAIKDVKDFFERELAAALGLVRVTAPVAVRSGLGINDDLNGIEQPVRFSVTGDDNAEVEIVQSLAKWKRLALAEYGFDVGEGLYTDMNSNFTASCSRENCHRRWAVGSANPASACFSSAAPTWAKSPAASGPTRCERPAARRT